ncbi:MAG: class I SAM-dependent methyltransferase [candidate division NC10 bacterium]|nr:class I SAM-dependent methyltransferase [candidate division NC10 bacterium]
MAGALRAARLAAPPHGPARGLEAARVRAGVERVTRKTQDYVADLGSGDGRIVIGAAKRFGAQAWGIEYDSKLVQESCDHARREGVADRASFLQEESTTWRARRSKTAIAICCTQPESHIRGGRDSAAEWERLLES